jgi:F-type H+-transporting ATPase subunit delta
VLASRRFLGAARVAPQETSLQHSKGLRLGSEANSLAEPLTADPSVAEAPIVSGMAGRYATALFELALEAGAIDAVESDLQRFQALLTESEDLTQLVRSPVFSAQEQLQALAAVLDRDNIGGIAANFLKLVAANRRLFAVREMIGDFVKLAARHRGEVTATLTVAEAVSTDHLDDIRNTLAAVTGKNVKIDVKIDASIIGGLVVKLGSRMIDTSLRTKLNALRQAMKEVG